MLEGAGHQVDLATDGDEAVALALQHDYDIVLMDILMPALSGIEATRKIRHSGSACADVPILAVTASVLPEQMDACFAAGMDGFIEKPIRVDALKTALERVSRRKAPADRCGMSPRSARADRRGNGRRRGSAPGGRLGTARSARACRVQTASG
ncbi:response regulator [Siccirubricoccus deserti]